MSPESNTKIIEALRKNYQPSINLLNELDRRKALPKWATLDQDWLTSFHQNLTKVGWPEYLQKIGVTLTPSGLNIASAIPDVAILMPVSTPEYLRSLLELIKYPVVYPNSSDPNAQMLISGPRMNEAAQQLEFILGMLKETGFLDSPDSENTPDEPVLLGSRFLYYHELGHLNYNKFGVKELPDWEAICGEAMVQEVIADQFAFGMTALELRNHPRLQSSAFIGIVLAMGFIALKEFADEQRIEKTSCRMEQIFAWAHSSVESGEVTKEAITFGTMLWKITLGLLARVKEIPSPISLLFMETIERPQKDWQVVSNCLLQWCAFGDAEKVHNTVRKIRDEARQQANEEPRARRVLDVINFVLEDTSEVESVFGLQEALDRQIM